jgi:hypothetical protein
MRCRLAAGHQLHETALNLLLCRGINCERRGAFNHQRELALLNTHPKSMPLQTQAARLKAKSTTNVQCHTIAHAGKGHHLSPLQNRKHEPYLGTRMGSSFLFWFPNNKRPPWHCMHVIHCTMLNGKWQTCALLVVCISAKQAVRGVPTLGGSSEKRAVTSASVPRTNSSWTLAHPHRSGWVWSGSNSQTDG